MEHFGRWLLFGLANYVTNVKLKEREKEEGHMLIPSFPPCHPRSHVGGDSHSPTAMALGTLSSPLSPLAHPGKWELQLLLILISLASLSLFLIDALHLWPNLYLLLPDRLTQDSLSCVGVDRHLC